MKIRELIEALSIAPDLEREVEIQINQTNKLHGCRLPISDGLEYENPKIFFSVNNGVSSTTITVRLPDKAYIAGLPKDMKPF